MSDGDGLRMAYCWRGASSIKCCLRHSNVLKKGCDLAVRTRGKFCEISCDDPDLFQGTTTREFHNTLDLVAEAHARFSAGIINKTMYERIIYAYGFNYVPDGLPYDKVLRAKGVDVLQAARKDWMHSALQDGLLTVEGFDTRDSGSRIVDYGNFQNIPTLRHDSQDTDHALVTHARRPH